MSKPQLRLVYTDGGDDFEGYVTRALSPRFEIVIDTEHPELCIYSTFGNSHKRYNCKKLWISGENDYPDFNICDYAVSCHNIHYCGRHLRVPFYAFRREYHNLNKLEYSESEFDTLFNRKFCSALISDKPIMDPRRIDIFKTVNNYKQVGSAGSFMNTLGDINTMFPRNTWVEMYDKFNNPQKYLLLKDYKFNLALENSEAEGYVTEKIVDAFAAKTIPIYFGTDDVTAAFNRDSFIYATHMSTKEITECVTEINTDRARYIQMLTAPKIQDYTNFIEEFNIFLNEVADGTSVPGHGYGWMKCKL